MQRSEEKARPKPGWVEKDGVMTGSLTNDRLMVVPTKFMASAKQFLVSAYGDSVRLVMNRIAREIGMSYGNLWKEDGLSPYESLHLLAEMGEKAGWGGLSVDGDLDKGKGLTFTIANCAFCAAANRGADGKCDFMAGIAEGICKATYGREFRSELEGKDDLEKRCVLAVKEADDRNRGNWKTAVYFPWMIDSQ